MSERVLAYFTALESRTNEELDRTARELAVSEKQEAARLVAHITEIGRRDYHLELGYKNLFEYCVKRLNLSEGSVYRRTQVARVCRRFPQILDALFAGRLHLTGASLIAPHLTEDTVETLIAQAAGKTKRQLERLRVTLAPKKTFEPSIRKQPPGRPTTKPSEENPATPAPPGAQGEKPASTRSPGPDRSGPAGSRRTPDVLEPATEDRFNFRFSAGREFTEKFSRLAEVLGIESPRNHMEEIFEKALECALEKKDPARKLERRRKREAKKEAAQESPGPRPGEPVKKAETSRQEGEAVERGSQKTADCESEIPAVSRSVPSDVRERVLERAGYRCQYRSPDGVRCRSRTALQVEHTRPFAVWRSHDEQYLEAYCPAHNRFAATTFYGREFIQGKIEARRRSKEERSAIRSATVSDTCSSALPAGCAVPDSARRSPESG